jgi:hypothetical protein
MAMVDYGALLRVNGKFINKNKGLFMDMKDAVGFVLETAKYPQWHDININDNYFVYAGCEDLLLCFYKTYFYVISNGEVVRTYSDNNLEAETLLVNGISIKVKHLDNDWIIDKLEIDYDDKKYVSKNKWSRYIKRVGEVNRKRPLKYKTHRYIASWEHNEKIYEVIFGYGIEPNEDVWNTIKCKSYEFTDKERKIIDEWFK